MTYSLKIKRVYDAPSPKDGHRILVDRLWPRGLSKEKAQIDMWMKELAPSHELRRWFDHIPERWKDFQMRYALELQGSECLDLLGTIYELKSKTDVTLLFAAKDELHNNAVVIQNVINGR